MKRILLVLACTALFSRFSFSADPVNSSLFGSVAIDGYDTVAYWTDNAAVEGKKQFSYQFNGAKWRFATQQNLDLFKQDPDKYLPEYGGYCAWAMSDDSLASIDGEAWTFFEGKLYLNYNRKVMAEWRQSKAAFVTLANGFYKARFPKQTQSQQY